MRDLLQKYPLGYEGYRLEKGLPSTADQATANSLAAEANSSLAAQEIEIVDPLRQRPVESRLDAGEPVFAGSQGV
jgi:hypothetical protein